MNVNHRTRDHRFNLDGSVGPRCGCTTDQQRCADAAPFHLACDVNHLIETWRDQTRQADDGYLVLECGLENPFAADHHAQVDHVVPIATQDNADDVLANIVNVTFDGGQQDLLRTRAFTHALVRL